MTDDIYKLTAQMIGTATNADWLLASGFDCVDGSPLETMKVEKQETCIFLEKNGWS